MKTNYLSALAEFKSQLDRTNADYDELTLESAFESFTDWSTIGSVETVRSWFENQRQQSQFNVKTIPLFDCKGWALDPDTGWISHQSGEFFYIQGVRVSFSKDREVEGGWDQPIITQVGYDGGLLGLLRKRIEGVPHYLVEAKAEPGNPDQLQISPTLQATFSNLKRAHGGRAPRFAEYFEQPEKFNARVLRSQWMSEDGGRLHLKRNKGILIEVAEDHQMVVPSTFAWASLFQLKSLIRENSWVNPHVRGIISSL